MTAAPYSCSPSGAANCWGPAPSPNLARIIYTVPSGFGHFDCWIKQEFRSNWSHFGDYHLEITPEPIDYFTRSGVTARHSAREVVRSLHRSHMTSLRDRCHSANADLFHTYGVQNHAQAGAVHTRQMHRASGSSTWNVWKLPTYVLTGATFHARGVAGSAHNAEHSAITQSRTSTSTVFHVRSIAVGQSQSRVDSHVYTRLRQQAQMDATTRPGWSIHARDTATNEDMLVGFIDAEDAGREITDVALPDGVYEIEVRPSEHFWAEARTRRIVTLVAGDRGDPGVTPVTGLPTIQNLRAEIVNFHTVIRWDISDEHVADGCTFGVWYSPTTPVDTSGAPAASIPYTPGRGTYTITRQQTEAEHVAVRSLRGDDMGTVAELPLPWDTGTHSSPADQVSL